MTETEGAGARLRRSFYSRESLTVARELVGMHLIYMYDGVPQRGRIVETEAYCGPEDLAAHSSRGRTARTEVMFGPPGHAYVYLIYGIWDCLNVVVAAEGTPHAVLIRAVEPIAHLEQRTWGPGLLCRAYHITRAQNGMDLCGEQMWLERPADWKRHANVQTATRIGVDYAGEWAKKPWRFYDPHSPYVSTVSAAKRKRVLAQGMETGSPPARG